MAQDSSDQVLICAYARNHCESSFGELVNRHVDLVHSVALRILRDTTLAEDVTQRVFLTLARHAAKLQGRVSLTGWLHETARNAAINTVRSEERRRRREQEAATMNPLDANGPELLWQQIAQHLDEALAQLSDIEREVILWRYFERNTSEQIGQRLGLTAEAAQKRVARALERLREILARNGLKATAAALAALVSANAVQSAPVGLAATAIAAATAAGTLIPATSTLQILMASTKVKLALTAALAATVATPLVLQHQTNTHLRDEIARLQAERAPAPQAQTVSTDASEAASPDGEHQELLRLRGLVAQLRQQIANQPKPPTNTTADGRNKTESLRASELENAKTLLSKAPEIPLVRSNAFRNAGYGTAVDSFHTLNWATANRDTNAMLNAVGLEPDARTRANELFAQMPEAIRQKYGTVDALLVDWAMNLAEPPEAYRVLSQQEEGDAARLTVQFQYPSGRVRENDVVFYRDPNGTWRRTIPSGIVEKLPSVINNLAQGPAGGR